MSFYLDTSLLVSVLTPESSTEKSQDWLDRNSTEDLAISDWVVTEFSAALSIKVRTGQLATEQRARVLAAFVRLVDTLNVFDLDRRVFWTAASFADRSTLGVRADDALHLAVAATQGATLCTCDRRLAEAGPIFGVATQLV